MNDLANTMQGEISILDGLAVQAQMFSCGAAMNLLQLGRVLTEAKPLVPHGQWIEWVRINAHLPARTAQQYMQAYGKFGLDNEIAQLGPTQIIKLLPMSDEEREELLSENDVKGMTTRELDEAIRAQRERLRSEAMEEAQATIAAERSARMQAEQRTRDAENRPATVPEEVIDELRSKDRAIAQYREELDRIGNIQKELMEQRNAANRELSDMRRDLKETEEMLAESQQEYNRMQDELLNAKSIIAKGDAERSIGQQLTADDFSSAVRQFVGSVAQMPFMGATFASMDQQEILRYDEFLRTIEDWAKRARSALDTVESEVIYGE